MSENKRKRLKHSQRWIVKIGSALLTAEGQGLDIEALERWVAQIAALRSAGIEVILVSSGAIAEGMTRLGWDKRPAALHDLQAAAAIGQMGLVQAYEVAFKHYNVHTAQILLTHDDLSNRRRYLNAKTTLESLLKLGIVPIVNENDTVAYDEIQFGDNDTLGALVANLITADILVILTDQQGLYNKDPRQFSDAELIPEGSANDGQFLQFAGAAGTHIGSGGMKTKILAAQRAARSGCHTLIASGREANILQRLYHGENIGTLLYADCEPLVARKQWLAGHLRVRGGLWLDAGAVQAICKQGKSLLSAGVVKCEGGFSRGDMVKCFDQNGQVVAQGLVNYSCDECKKIAGYASESIESLLGVSSMIDEELIHRNNLVIF